MYNLHTNRSGADIRHRGKQKNENGQHLLFLQNENETDKKIENEFKFPELPTRCKKSTTV